MWIGYSHVDRLITYPYAHNLSASGLLESAAGPSQNPKCAPVVGSMGAPGNVRRRAQPESQARTCGGDPWARRATCVAEPSQNPKRAPVVGSMGAQGAESAPHSSYRLVSMATRQPVVPQILKE